MKPCLYPGCSALVQSGLCEKHRTRPRYCAQPGCPVILKDGTRWCQNHEPKKRHDEKRGGGRSRGYDRDWEKLQRATLAADPLCTRCAERGKIAPADLVHHIIPLRAGGSRLDPANLMPLCRACHDIIHKEATNART